MGSFGVTGWHDEARAPGPGVAIGRSGASIGKATFVLEPYWPLNTCLYVTDFRGNDPRWVYHLLDLIDFSGYNSGSAQPSLNRNFLARIPVLVPDVATQRRIGAVLGALDDLIEANRVLMRQLTATARAAYDRLVEPWSRETPFSETVDVISGGTPKTTVPEYWDGGIPWYSVVDAPASDSPWVLSTAKTISPSGLANSPTRLLPERATIISARGTVGTLALVGVPMAMNQSCYGLRSLVGSQGYFTYYSTQDIVDELRQGAHGSVFDTITRDSLSRVMVRVPDESAINGFEVKVTPLMDLARELAAENVEIIRTRHELLPLLMSGRVRVSEDLEVA